jgi:hypothetical protein
MSGYRQGERVLVRTQSTERSGSVVFVEASGAVLVTLDGELTPRLCAPGMLEPLRLDGALPRYVRSQRLPPPP